MKTLIENIIKTEEDKRLFAQEGLILNVTEMICQLMEQTSITKKQLAQKMGTNQSHITQLLNGTREISLRTLSDILFYLQFELKLDEFINLKISEKIK